MRLNQVPRQYPTRSSDLPPDYNTVVNENKVDDVRNLQIIVFLSCVVILQALILFTIVQIIKYQCY